MGKYKRTIMYQDYEKPAKLDMTTGEYLEVRNLFSGLPEGKEQWLHNETFEKMFKYSWSFLVKKLTAVELQVLVIMTLMIETGTNALIPLNDELSMYKLQEFFGIDRKKIKVILKKLFDIGVYAKFEVSKRDEGYKKYWILNPYVSFNGKLISSDIPKLFYGTEVEIEYAKKYMSEKKKRELMGSN